MMNKKPRSNEVMWYILGGYFIIVGLVSMQSLNIWTGILFVLAGVTLFPVLYKNFNSKYKKYIRIIIPGAFYKMAAISAVITVLISGCAEMNSKTVPEPETITTEEAVEEEEEPEEDTEIKSLHFGESEAEMEINSSKEIILEVSPENFEVQDLELCSSNNEVAFLEKSEEQNENGKLKLQLKSGSEGECEVFVKSSNEIESNRVFVKVTDSQKHEEENNQEEDPQPEETPAEETVQETKKEETPAQENYQKPKETKTETKSNSNSNKSQQSGSSKPNTNNTHGAHIYCTPKGKRYHFDPDCGGKNSRETTWAEAQARGLTPCKKCAK